MFERIKNFSARMVKRLKGDWSSSQAPYLDEAARSRALKLADRWSRNRLATHANPPAHIARHIGSAR